MSDQTAEENIKKTKDLISILKDKVEESKLFNQNSKIALGSLLTSLEEIIGSEFDEAVLKEKIENLEKKVKDLLEKKIEFANPDLEKSLESFLNSLKLIKTPSENGSTVTQKVELLEIVKKLVENIKYLLSKNMKGFLYHVTNIKENDDLSWTEIRAFSFSKDYYHPNLPFIDDVEQLTQTLESTRLDDNSSSSSSEQDLPGTENLKCAFLSCTLYNNRLPTISPYPKGGKNETRYKRIIIPFETIILNYPICWFWCAFKGQVHYICGKVSDEEKIEKSILEGYKEYEKNKIKDNNVGMKLNEHVKENENRITINEKIPEKGDIPHDKYKIIYKRKTNYVLPRIQNDYDTDKVFYNIAVYGFIPLNNEISEVGIEPSTYGDYKIDVVKHKKWEY